MTAGATKFCLDRVNDLLEWKQLVDNFATTVTKQNFHRNAAELRKLIEKLLAFKVYREHCLLMF